MMDPWISEEHQNTSNSAESLDSPSSQRKLPTNVSLAKRRLQAYSNSKLLMKDAKKAEEKAPAKDEKKSKKALYPDDRARAVISEIEEIKKKEAEEEEKKALHGKEMLAVAIKTIATINRPRSRSLSAERDNHFKRRDIKSRNYRKIASKGRRRSLSSDSRPKKKYDQSDYPKTWQEYAEQALVTSKDIELKKKLFQGTSNKRDAFTKLYRFDTTWPSPQENFRPQENGLKEVPLAFIRVTKSKPAITFNVNFRKNKESFLSRSQLFQIVPKERKQIIEKLMQSSGCKTFTSKPPMTTRKWYQKSWKKMPEAECKVIENSVGLSFLQNYSDEEEETEEIAPLVSTEPITQEEEMECQKKEDDKTEDYKKEEPKETTKEEYTPERKSDSSKSRIARTKEAIKAIEEAIEKKKEKIKKEVAVTKLKKENKTKTKKKETSDSDSSNSEEETIKTKKYKRKKRQEKTSEDEEKSKKKNKKKVRLKTKSKRKLKKIIKESSDESEIEITKKKNKRTRILKKKSLKSDEHSSSEEIETTKNKKKRPKQMIEIATPETPQKEELQSQNYEDEFPLVKDTVISDENWEQDWEETELVPPPPKPKLNTSWESDEEIFERRNYNSERKIMECFDLEMPLNIPLKKRRLQDKPEEVSELEKVELNLWDKDKVSTPQIPEKDTSIYLETEYEEFMRALNSGEKSKPKPINCVIDLNEVESNIKFKPMEIPLPKEEPTNDIKPVPVPSPKVDVDKLPKSLINLSLSANITLDIASKVNSFQPVKVVESEEYKPSQPDEKLETIAPFSFSGMVLPTKKLLLDNSNLKLGDSDEDSKPEEDLADKLQETKKQTVNDLEDNGSTLKIKLEPQEDPLKSKHDLSPKITELSPKRTGESPGKRVDSPKKVIKSPRKKEESPKRREESPKKREESPKKREGSPRKREESPWKREESPRKREESPRRKKCSSPRRRRSKSPRRRRSPPRRDYSPRRKSPPSARKRSPAKRKYSSSYRPLSPGYRKRSQSPRRRSQSPRRRSQSPPRRKSQSPPRRRSQSPLRRRSQSPKQKRRSKSPDRRLSTGRHHRLSPKRKSSPIAPPLERLKRSIADSTISDDLLPQPGEYVQPPHYYKSAEAEELKPIETTYSNDYSYHNQYEMMGGFDHIGEEIKTEDMSLSNNTFVSNNFVQVGNMVQIVPVDIPIKNELVETPKIHRELTHIQVDNYYHHIPVSGPPPPPPPQEQTEKLLAEESMKKKMAERKAERERRRAEKERKRKEKEKRRREKEKQRQVRLKLKTENMIKRALQLEVAALAEDEEISTFNETPPQWPPLHYVQGVSKDLARSILRRAGQKKDKISPDKKCVQFADGVKPGEGTSPSGGEDLGSPPRRVMLPKEKRYTKTKLKKKIAKKKVKVKVIKKPDTPEQYDDEIDENLPPPSPPPGSPPPHIFPPRVKNNNIHQSLIGVVPGYGPTQLNLIMAPPPPPPPHHYPPPPHHHGPPHHGPPHHGPPPPPHHGPPHPHHGPPPPPPHHHHHPPPPGPPHHPPYHHY